MNNKRLLLLVTSIAVVGLIFLGAYKIFWFGKLSISGIEDFETVEVDGANYAAKTFPASLKLRPGSYQVNISGPTQKPIRQTIEISPLGTKKLQIESQALTAQEIVQTISAPNIPTGFRGEGAALFENNYWAVVFVNPISGQDEGWVDIYQFDGQQWQQLESGTGLDSEDLSRLGYPDSVINYLESAND